MRIDYSHRHKITLVTRAMEIMSYQLVLLISSTVAKKDPLELNSSGWYYQTRH